MGAILSAPLKPFNTIECCNGFRGPQLGPLMPGDASLSDSCRSDRCFFSSRASIVLQSRNFYSDGIEISRESDVSRHQGGPLGPPVELPDNSRHDIVPRGIRFSLKHEGLSLSQTRSMKEVPSLALSIHRYPMYGRPLNL